MSPWQASLAPDEGVYALKSVAAVVLPYDWAFRRERASEIATHWAQISAGKDAMFDGRVMLQHRGAIVDGVFQAAYFETDYSAFMAWRDAGYPGPVIRNGFAMAALRASDGAYLCGRMGPRTANPGKVYFPAGTPDRDDLRPDGSLDLAGSAIREVTEETGLREDELIVGEGWTAVVMTGLIAFMRLVTVPLPAQQARALMLSRMATQADPELSDIVIVRDRADCENLNMPPFMLRYIAHIEAGG